MVLPMEWHRKIEDEVMVVLEREDYEGRKHRCYIFHYGYMYFVVISKKGARQVYDKYEYQLEFPKYFNELMEKLEIEGFQTAGEVSVICE